MKPQGAFWAAGLLAAGLALVAVTAHAADAPAKAPIHFVGIHDGETVSSPVKFGFGMTGTALMPEAHEAHGSHVHLLIDTQLTSEQMKRPIPADAHHRHFGKDMHEVAISLPPGKHRLQLLLGNGHHVLQQPLVMSEPIMIMVR